jgi:hypothetical protein
VSFEIGAVPKNVLVACEPTFAIDPYGSESTHSRLGGLDRFKSAIMHSERLCTVNDYAQCRIGGSINKPSPRFPLHIIFAVGLVEPLLLARPIGLMLRPQRVLSAGDAPIHSSRFSPDVG